MCDSCRREIQTRFVSFACRRKFLQSQSHGRTNIWRENQWTGRQKSKQFVETDNRCGAHFFVFYRDVDRPGNTTCDSRMNDIRGRCRKRYLDNILKNIPASKCSVAYSTQYAIYFKMNLTINIIVANFSLESHL